jgi:hypothetical protein
MLPFLKERHEASVSSPVETDEKFGMLDAVVDDLLEAVHKKDKKMLKAALELLVEHIQEADEEQDHEEMNP